MMDLCKWCLTGSGEGAMESSERQRECVTFRFGLDGSSWEQHGLQKAKISEEPAPWQLPRLLT